MSGVIKQYVFDEGHTKEIRAQSQAQVYNYFLTYY